MSPVSDTVLAKLEAALGRHLLMTDPEYARVHAVDGCIPAAVVHPTTVEEVQEAVRFCIAERLALIPSGWRNQTAWAGLPGKYDVALTLREMAKVTSYDPGDLTLSCQAGITLKDLQGELRPQKQFLPLESECGDLCTVGGVLATNASGPLRYSYGTAKDFLLGMEFVTGEGKLCKSGARVVKSVAGYDLHKLLVGSFGTLAVITSANFRTFPIPPATATFVASFASPDSAVELLHAVRRSSLQPRAMDLVSPEVAEWAYDPDPDYSMDPLPFPRGLWSVAIAAAGKEQVVERHRRDLDKLAAQLGASSFEEACGERAESLWDFVQSVTECDSITVLGRATAVVKIATLPHTLLALLRASQQVGQEHDLSCMTIVRAACAVYVTLDVDDAEEKTVTRVQAACERLMQAAAQVGCRPAIQAAHAELKKRVNVWGLVREDFALMQRLKQVFDPHGILSPGRFVGGL